MKRASWPSALRSAALLFAGAAAWAIADIARASFRRESTYHYLILAGACLVGAALGLLYRRWRDAPRERRTEAALEEAEAERDALIDALAAERAQLRTILDTVPVGVLMAEFPSGRIVSGNKYVEHILRHPVLFSPDFESYSDWIAFHSDGSRVQSREYPLARILAGEENPEVEIKYQRGDGTLAWVRALGRPVTDSAGEVVGGVVAILDVNEERLAKEALEQAIEMKEMLLYEVNHRVKNSLQLVTSILAVEASGIEDAEARQSVLDARRKISIVAQLHQRLYSSGRHATVDFKAYLDEMMAGLLNSSGAGHGPRMAVEWEGNPTLSIKQAAPLGLALNELVTNAIKHALGEQGGSLEIRGTRREGVLELVVEDDGPGLPEDFATATPGSLGLQIVTNLVKQLDGRLESSKPGRGTRFTISVPAPD